MPATTWRRPFAAVPPERMRTALTCGVAFLALVFPLLHNDDADIDSAANAMSYAALALGLNIVVGMTGLLDLGYAAFFAIGAYFYGVLSSFQLQPEWSSFWEPFGWLGLVGRIPGPHDVDVVHTTLSFWLALPLAGIVAALCGIAFGAPTLRLRGDYLAIVTLGFGEIIPIVARNWTSVTNGAAGLNGVAPPTLAAVGGSSFGVDAMPYYYVIAAVVAVLIFISIRLRDSRVGRAWMAIREDEIAAGAMGVNLVRYKLLAFAIGASFAGMTGTFYVAKLQTATPEMFGFPVSVMILVMVVLGGMGSVWGVVLGAMILQLLQSWFLQDLTQWLHQLGELVGSEAMQQIDLVQSIELIFGIILVLMMLYRREGLIPAHRKATALTFDQQHATVERLSAITLPGVAPTAERGKPLLEVQGVTVRFGGLVALNALNLTVPEGGVLAVIGPNGSGKSTLFNVITGLTPAASGTIRFAGKDLYRPQPGPYPGRRRRAHLPEHPAVHQPFGDGQRAGRRPPPPAQRPRPLHPAPAHDAPGGARGAGAGDGNPVAVRQPPGAPRGPAGQRAQLRQPPPGGDCPRARLRPPPADAGRAHRRHEPGRDDGTGRTAQAVAHARPHHPGDRAQAGRGGAPGRHRRGSGPWRETDGGPARRGAPQRGRARRLSRPQPFRRRGEHRRCLT